jgi:hypothetical protein
LPNFILGTERRYTGLVIRKIARFVGYLLAGLVCVAALAFGADYASVTFGIPKREMFDTIKVDQLYAVPNKWNEVDWSRGTPVMERCVNSLFPHFGSRPCWYVRRDTMHVNQL